MNDLYRKWLDALRSGKYTQTKQVLRDEDGFCCLGVACDIYDSSLWEGGTYMGNDIDLHPEVNDAYGLIPFRSEGGDDVSDGYFFDVSVEEFCEITGLDKGHYVPTLTLILLNDEYGLDFNQIADVLEKYHDRIVR